MEAQICRGSWCLAFGMETIPTLEQVVKVLSAFGYDGIELGGFFDHATVERYPGAASRAKLVEWIGSHDLEIAGYAPGPYGDFGKPPWATGGDDVVAAYEAFFADHLQFCVDCGIPAMRVDPGDFGPLARDADYDKAWDRVVTLFRKHAEEAVKLMNDVGHVEATCVIAHNHVQPHERLAGGQLEFIEMMKGKIGHMHVCDTDSDTWHNAFGTHLGIGKGGIDFDALIPAALDAGSTGEWWSVDAIPMTAETWADTWSDRIALDALLDKHVRSR